MYRVGIASVGFFLLFFFAAGLMANPETPDYYSEPGINPHRDYLNQTDTDVIDPFTGKLQLHYVDAFVPGNGGLDIKVQRSYTSLDDELPPTNNRSVWGIGWKIHFGRIIRSEAICENTNLIDTNNNPVFELPDGSRRQLVHSGIVELNNFNGSVSNSTYFAGNIPDYVTSDLWLGFCQYDNGNSRFVLHSPDGMIYTLSKLVNNGDSFYWYVTQIEDRNGNTLSFSYHGDDNLYSSYNTFPLLREIRASDGRVVTFSYTGLNVNSIGSVRLHQVRAANQTWTYEYDQSESDSNQYKLTRVVRPDGSNYRYQYVLATGGAGRYSIRTVTHPYGGQTNYTYIQKDMANDGVMTTVVLKKTYSAIANIPPAEWTFEYKPGHETYLTGQLDQTTVNGPSGKIVYQHIGYQAAVSDTSATYGVPIWKIGLLKKKLYCSPSVASCNDASAIQTETTDWIRFTISDEDDHGPRGLHSGGIYAPFPDTRVITRDGSTYTTEYTQYSLHFNVQEIVESGSDTKTTRTSYYPPTNGKWRLHDLRQKQILDPVDPSLSEYFYDGNGNLTSKDEDGVVTQYTYYQEGDLETETDARLVETSYYDYYRGIAREEHQPENVILKRTVNPIGTVASETDGETNTTYFTYDDLGRLTGIDYPLNADVSIDWTGRQSVLTRGNYRETKRFDGFGRTIATEVSNLLSGETITVTTELDEKGNKLFESYPNDTIGTEYTYDILSRPVTTLHPDNTTNRFDYVSGNRVIYKDERENLTTSTYVAYGDPDARELIKIEALEGVTTDIERNKLGMVKRVVQNGVERRYQYDSKLFLVNRYDPEIGYTYYDRDEVGNMTASWVGNAEKTTYIYDDQGRPKSIDYPDNITYDVEYTYDKNGNLKTIKNDVVEITYDYDFNDNLLSEYYDFGGISYRLGYETDELDHVSKITYPSGRVINLNPDAFGRTTGIAPYVSNVTYYPSGQLKSYDLGNGKRAEYQLNNRLRVESIRQYEVNGQDIFNTSYVYDGLGNIEQISDAIRPQYSRTLTYDGVNRLATAAGVWGSGTLHYDHNGNISEKNIGQTNLSYTYNSNKLSNISGSVNSSYTYDNYGNIINNGSHRFKYDIAGNLRVLSDSNGPIKYYHYDGSDHLAYSETSTEKNFFIHAKNGDLYHEVDWKNRSSIDYIYLGNQLVAKIEDKCDSASLDSDSDGIPDCGETNYGLDAADPADAAQDTDGDGLSNLEEFALGTEYGNADSDADGMPDGYEADVGLDPLVNDAILDNDNDGYTNYEEYLGGSSPTGGDSVPNGAVIWNFDLNGTTSSPPVLDRNGTIYAISTSGNVYAVDTDGTQLWSYFTDPECSGHLAIGEDQTIYAGCNNGRLHALNPDGSLKWVYDVGGHIAISHDAIYVSDESGACNAGGVHKLDLNGNQLWTYETKGRLSDTIVVDLDGTVYGVSTPKPLPDPLPPCSDAELSEIVAINDDGSLKWSYTVDRLVSPVSTSIGIGGTLYVGLDTSYLALNPDGTFKEEIAIYLAGDGEANILPSATFGTDDTLYTLVGPVQAYDTHGLSLWSATDAINYAGTETVSSVTVGRGGSLYGAAEGLARVNRDGTNKWVVDRFGRQQIDYYQAGSTEDNQYYAGETIRFSVSSGSGSSHSCPAIPTNTVPSGPYTGSVLVCGSGGGGGTRSNSYPSTVETPSNDWVSTFDPANFLTALSTPRIGSDGTLYMTNGGHLLAVANRDELGASHSVWPTDGRSGSQEFFSDGCVLNGSDADADGMPDCYELMMGLDPAVPGDADEDIDSDGLTNRDEYSQRTNPHNRDSDGDVLPDGYEVTNNLGPRSNNPQQDSDGDGVINGVEYFAGTSPVDSADRPNEGTYLWAYLLDNPFNSQVLIKDNGNLEGHGVPELSFMGKYVRTRIRCCFGPALQYPAFSQTDDGVVVMPKPTDWYVQKNIVFTDYPGQIQDQQYGIGAEITSSLAFGNTNEAYIVNASNELYSLNLLYRYWDMGQQSVNWTLTLDGNMNASPSVALDGTVYLGTSAGTLYAVDDTGQVKWTFSASAEIVSAPALTKDGSVYFTTADGNLYAVDSAGNQQWVYSTNDTVSGSPVIATDGSIHFGTLSGVVYAIAKEGTLKWSYDSGSPIQATAAVGESGNIYFGNDAGTLSALAPDGSLAWSLPLGSSTRIASPKIDQYGILYIATQDANLHAIYVGEKAANSDWPMYGHDGRNTSNVATSEFSGNQPPVLSIDTPNNGDAFAQSIPVAFSATASDAEDGDLSQQVQWVSNLDGSLGVGDIISTTLSVGEHQITASVADGQGLSVTAVVTITIGSQTSQDVDLVMGSLAHAVTGIAAGESFSVSSTVANQGADTTTSPTEVHYYLSTDATITADDTLVGTETVAEVAGNGSVTLNSTLTAPPSVQEGAYYIGAIADATNLQAETDEANNALAATDQIQVTGGIDLTATAIDVPPGDIAIGTNVTLSGTIANQGSTATAVGGFNVGYYLSTDATITTDDQLLGRDYVGSLGAGATLDVSRSVPISIYTQPGTYYFGLLVDYDGRQTETDESNNGLVSGAVQIVRVVDLTATAINVPSGDIAIGTDVTLSGTVANQGSTVTGGGGFNVGYYLSTDAAITTDDQLLGRDNVSSLGAGATLDVSRSVPISVYTQPGTYYFGLLVDYDGRQAETDESNNAISSQVNLVQ
jgi:YD repeat-containing protein